MILIKKEKKVIYSIMDASLVSRMWSVRIQGMDISMGNWILRPIVSSRKNSLNQSWERSQHCCRVSARTSSQGFVRTLSGARGAAGSVSSLLTAEVQQVCVKEGLLVKLFNVQNGGTLKTAAQSLLRAAFVSNERLQHGPHHVELKIYT